MDVKGGVHNLGELEEVGISCVGRRASEDSLENNISLKISLDMSCHIPSEGWRIRQESKAGKKERNHHRPQRPSCSPAQSASACCLRR